MFLAQFITQMADTIIGLITVMIFVMVDVIRSTKNDMIVNVTFINMSGNNVRIFPL